MAGQIFTVLLVHFSLGITLPLLPLLAAIALIPLPNFWLYWRGENNRTLRGSIALALFIYDIAQLGLILALTGGLDNPFCIMLLLPVALAATTLDRTSIIVVTTFALCVISTIMFINLPMPWPDGEIALPRLYTAASWIAIGLALTLIAAYVWQLASDSRRQADAFSATQLALAREQQFSALGTQAAAVAHHLGTPLATINIVAKELVRELPDDHPLAQEAMDLLNESRRCREILSTLGKPDNAITQDGFIAMPLSSIVEELIAPYRHGSVDIRVHSVVEPGCDEPSIQMPSERRHALANLIENATSFAKLAVDVTIRSGTDFVVITIEDDGPGFPPEVMDRIGEPYISTRRSDGGLGLGLFIANSLLVRTGAKLHFGNTTRGAQVRIQWPRDALTAELETIDG